MTETPERSLIPYLFFAFLGVVFAANAVMIWYAVMTFTGLETTSAYEKGLACNETLSIVRRQERLG